MGCTHGFKLLNAEHQQEDWDNPMDSPGEPGFCEMSAGNSSGYEK